MKDCELGPHVLLVYVNNPYTLWKYQILDIHTSENNLLSAVIVHSDIALLLGIMGKIMDYHLVRENFTLNSLNSFLSKINVFQPGIL